jgi:hypothetical protein
MLGVEISEESKKQLINSMEALRQQRLSFKKKREEKLNDLSGFDSFNLKEFYPTGVPVAVAMFAYNLMSIFRMFILKSEVLHSLSTLRYRNFVTGAFFQKYK